MDSLWAEEAAAVTWIDKLVVFDSESASVPTCMYSVSDEDVLLLLTLSLTHPVTCQQNICFSSTSALIPCNEVSSGRIAAENLTENKDSLA